MGRKTESFVSALFAALAVGCIVFIAFISLQEDKANQMKIQECNNSGKIYDGWCKTKYEYCLKQVRNTFQDLTDTVGVSQNNQDSVSKSMREEIDRCLSLN